MIRSLAEIMGWDKPARSARRTRLKLDLAGVAVYAIGDVHGCHEALIRLEEKIVEDAAELDRRKIIIMLGDYVDRGPDSASVIEHLLEPPPAGFERICLAGNHELLMLDALDGALSLGEWAQMGGLPTMRSYGLDIAHMNRVLSPPEQLSVLRRSVPPAHADFLRSLPILVDAGSTVFVHAGIRPGIPLAEQADRDLMFIRSEFFDNAHHLRTWVVHGHTPVKQARLEGRRLNVDTAAFRTGRLTAARILDGRGRILATASTDTRA